jgi:hypothetical protein
MTGTGVQSLVLESERSKKKKLQATEGTLLDRG